MIRQASGIVLALALTAAGLVAAGCREKAKDPVVVEKPAVDTSTAATPAAPVTAAPAAPAAPATDSPAAIVDSLYKIHNNGLGPILSLEGTDGEKYRRQLFDSTLATLIHKNLVGPANGDVGNLDFDPFYNSQDIEISRLKVGEPAIQGDSATVPVTFNNYKDAVTMSYHLHRTADGWRIGNIVYGDGDLVKQLSQPW